MVDLHRHNSTSMFIICRVVALCCSLNLLVMGFYLFADLRLNNSTLSKVHAVCSSLNWLASSCLFVVELHRHEHETADAVFWSYFYQNWHCVVFVLLLHRLMTFCLLRLSLNKVFQEWPPELVILCLAAVFIVIYFSCMSFLIFMPDFVLTTGF